MLLGWNFVFSSLDMVCLKTQRECCKQVHKKKPAESEFYIIL